MFSLIRRARLFAPEDLGQGDVLVAAGRIAQVAREIEPQAGLKVEVVDAAGGCLTPGFIDLHVHLTGGGGEGGPATRCPELHLSRFVEAGVTTVLGMLGTDEVTRSPESLLAKALALEAEGLTAFVLAGSYRFPEAATITGDVAADVALLGPVVGVGELAVADHRSAQPTSADLARVAAAARRGGLLGGKAGLVTLHCGEGQGGLDLLRRVVAETELPAGQFLPTHVNRTETLFDEAVAWALAGGQVDLTARGPHLPFALGAAEALGRLVEAGVSLEKITISSDAGGSMALRDETGRLVGLASSDLDALLAELKALIQDVGLLPSQALPALTRNPATRLKLEGRKGRIAPGLEADLLLFDQGWRLDRVWTQGRPVAIGGRAMVKGVFD
jgi:beta-aspartyl-dipeptidase (metallo-type)